MCGRIPGPIPVGPRNPEPKPADSTGYPDLVASRENDPVRRPRRLYETGAEPDPRFTLANERTFLAWIRTSLALMAAGVGIEALNVVSAGTASDDANPPLQTTLAILLLAAGVVCSATAFQRWIATERALRAGEPLPTPRLAPVLGYGLAMIGVAAGVLVVLIGTR